MQFGAFLGNSVRNKTGVLEISSGNDEVPTKIAKLLSKQLNTKITTKKYKGNYTYYFYNKDRRIYAKDLTTNKELIKLLTNTYSYDKYITDEYKIGDISQRLELIKGLMDTDGSISKTYKLKYSSSSRQLIDDIKEVFRSLGNIYVQECKVDTRGSRDNYNLYISCDNRRKSDFFTVTSKLMRAKKCHNLEQNRHFDRLNIINIENLGYKEQSTCLYVDCDDHLYISGDTVVSHNTFFSQNLALNILAMGQRVIVLDPKNDFMKIKNIFPKVNVIDVNKIHDGALNPFTFLKVEGQQFDPNIIMTVVELLCGKLDKDDNTAISPIIEDFVREYERGKYQDLQGLADKLMASESVHARNIGTTLNRQAKSQYGKLFFTRDIGVEPFVIPENESLVLTMHGMPLPSNNKSADEYSPDERFISAILYVIIKKLRFILFLGLGRSLNIAVVLASQGITDFPSNIAQYISNKFVFKSSKEEANEFFSKFHSNLDVSKAVDVSSMIPTITQLKTGQCFFQDCNGRSGLIQIKTNFDINLLTSNPLGKDIKEDE